MKSANSRRPSMEVFEQRQLMAADLAVASEALSPPVDQNATELIQVAADDTSARSSISNGFQMKALRGDINDQLTLDALIIVEDSRPKDAEQLSLSLSDEQVQVAVDRVFAEADTNAESQLSEDEKEKWERLIHEVMKDFDERFEVRWQYVWGEGGLVTESFGPNDEWPV